MKPSETDRMLHQLARFIEGKRGQVIRQWLERIDFSGHFRSLPDAASPQRLCSDPRMHRDIDALLLAAPAPQRFHVTHDGKGGRMLPTEEFIALMEELDRVRRTSFALWWMARPDEDACIPCPAQLAA